MTPSFYARRWLTVTTLPLVLAACPRVPVSALLPAPGARLNTSMGASLCATLSCRGLQPKKAATPDFLPGLTALTNQRSVLRPLANQRRVLPDVQLGLAGVGGHELQEPVRPRARHLQLILV